LTNLTIGELMASPHGWPIATGCATEGFAVAKARGIKLDFDDPVAYVRAFGEKIPHARPSMLLDHMSRRRSEIDNINGAIPREGAKVGVSTPISTVLTELVRAKEAAF
jgi:2-dehydropantoate 2-reductase